MVTQLQPDVRAYLHGGEVIKRYIRVEEVAHEYGFSVEETEYIAKAASSLYKLTRIHLVKKERFDEFMKHIYKVPGTNKQIIKKFARIGEASIIYSIGRHRFIELARAAGATYKINEGTGGTVLVNLEIFDNYMEQFRQPVRPLKAFFTSIGNLVGLISAGTTTQLAIDSTQADIIKGLGFGESLVMLILTALLAIIIIICGFFIIYTVYFRFLKILIIVPLGAIACSTMAGNRMVSHTMATYCKYFLSCVFEAVTMALAIVVCNAFINAGLPAFTGSYADWAQTLIYLCEMTFTIAMTVGSVKGAQTLTSKAFGL